MCFSLCVSIFLFYFSFCVSRFIFSVYISYFIFCILGLFLGLCFLVHVCRCISWSIFCRCISVLYVFLTLHKLKGRWRWRWKYQSLSLSLVFSIHPSPFSLLFSLFFLPIQTQHSTNPTNLQTPSLTCFCPGGVE